VQAGESACLGIPLHQHPDQPGRLLLVERWADRAVYEGPHMTMPRLPSSIAAAPQFRRAARSLNLDLRG
jgi:quinol monooxygenase YgiN